MHLVPKMPARSQGRVNLLQEEDSSSARIEFPIDYWEAAGGSQNDPTSVVWRVAAALRKLPLLEKALVPPPWPSTLGSGAELERPGMACTPVYNPLLVHIGMTGTGSS